MELQEKIKKGSADTFMKISIVQTLFVLVVIISIVITKYFFKNTYLQIREWYKQNICVSTDVNEVMEEDYEI